MGTFRYPVEIAATAAGPFTRVEAIIDTGATYSMFPRPLIAQFGISPQEQAEFVPADGRRALRDLVIVTMRLDGRIRPGVCVVGDDGTEPLLGAVTLESFGLAAGPREPPPGERSAVSPIGLPRARATAGA